MCILLTIICYRLKYLTHSHRHHWPKVEDAAACLPQVRDIKEAQVLQVAQYIQVGKPYCRGVSLVIVR